MLCQGLATVLVFGVGGLSVDASDSTLSESVHSTGFVTFPPGPGPHQPLPPREAIAYVFAVLLDKPPSVAEVREVVPARRLGLPVAVHRDTHDVIDRGVPRHAGGDLLDFPGLEGGLAALLVGHSQGGVDLSLTHASPTHCAREACQDVVALPRRYALP